MRQWHELQPPVRAHGSGVGAVGQPLIEHAAGPHPPTEGGRHQPTSRSPPAPATPHALDPLAPPTAPAPLISVYPTHLHSPSLSPRILFSLTRSNSEWANAALVVAVEPQDWSHLQPAHGPLAGVALQVGLWCIGRGGAAGGFVAHWRGGSGGGRPVGLGKALCVWCAFGAAQRLRARFLSSSHRTHHPLHFRRHARL